MAFARCVLVVLLASASLGAADASARVALLATGTNDALLVDVATNKVVRRVALPGPTTAVAVASDGKTGLLAGGGAVVTVDLRAAVASLGDASGGVAPTGGVVLSGISAPQKIGTGAPIVGLALSPQGGTAYAVSGTRLYALDAATLAPRRSIALHGAAQALAVSRDGSRAAVVLAKGRVAMVDLSGPRLSRRVRVPGAVGVAFAAGRAWVTAAHHRLRTIPTGAKKATKGIKLPFAGGALAVSPDGAHLAIGGRGHGAIADLATVDVHAFRSSSGPGAPAWSPDGGRVYVADGRSLSLVSAFSHRRTGTLSYAASSVAVQPGLALVLGTETNDTLLGTRSPDLLEGLGGNDVLDGGRDNDILHGDDGDDTLNGGPYDDRLDGGQGNDIINGSSGNDKVFGDAGGDTARGGTGNDVIHGGPDDDDLDGGEGDDRIYGEEGNDLINGGAFGNDARLYGGPGDDTIHGGRGSDRIIKGNEGNDKLYGESGTEHILGGDGDDLIDGGSARDLLEGNNGSDTIAGGTGDDDLDGGAGADLLDGGEGEDQLLGGDGADTITAGPGRDLVDAGSGDDTIRVADENADEVDCGDGNDTVYVESTSPTRDRLVSCESVVPIPPETATTDTATSLIRGTPGNDLLRGTDGPDSLFGKQGADRIFGGGGDDYVDGEWGNDELHGGAGNDTIAGRSGDDRIFGEDGDDRITGDRGADHISGGAGDDALFGNLGPDVVAGGSGDDRINVVRGEVDVVRCGSGKDTVLADGADHVASDCEDVRR